MNYILTIICVLITVLAIRSLIKVYMDMGKVLQDPHAHLVSRVNNFFGTRGATLEEVGLSLCMRADLYPFTRVAYAKYSHEVYVGGTKREGIRCVLEVSLPDRSKVCGVDLLFDNKLIVKLRYEDCVLGAQSVQPLGDDMYAGDAINVCSVLGLTPKIVKEEQ